MQKLLNKELLKDESKVYVCSQTLVTSLIIIKMYNNLSKKVKISNLNPFELMNSMNKNILEYLKTKYPRNKNLFVPVELESKFDRINFLTLHENNMLVNSGFSFSEKNMTRVEILDKTKNFINCLMYEVDTNFHVFTGLLNDKILKLSENIDLKLNKIKIGRKIPENTEKFF